MNNLQDITKLMMTLIDSKRDKFITKNGDDERMYKKEAEEVFDEVFNEYRKSLNLSALTSSDIMEIKNNTIDSYWTQYATDVNENVSFMPDERIKDVNINSGIELCQATMADLPNTALQNFLNYTSDPANNNSHMNIDFLQKIDENVFKYLAFERNSLQTCAVVAPIQSGKTGIIEGINHMVRGKFKKTIVIHLSANNTNISEQTIGRLSKGEEYYSKPEWNVAFHEDLTNISTLNIFTDHFVFNIKKNAHQLIQMSQILYSNEENIIEKEFEIFIIEDESDEASINTNKENEEATSTHRLVKELAFFNEKKTTHIFVTATIMANLAAHDPYEAQNLSIKNSISFFEAHKNYLSVSDIVQDCSVILKRNNMERDKDKNLLEVIGVFLAQIYVGKNKLVDGLDREKNTLLINKVTSNDEQIGLKKHVLKVLRNIDENELGKIIQYSLDKYFPHYNLKYFEVYSFSPKDIEVMVINQKTKSKDKFKFNESPMSIVIGGQSVSRGVTFDHLVSQYYYNDFTNSSPADTVMQSCRAAGNRLHLKNHIKVFALAKTFNCLRNADKVENVLKHRINTMDKLDINSLYDTLETGNINVSNPTKLRKVQINKEETYFSGTSHYNFGKIHEIKDHSANCSLLQKQIYSEFSDDIICKDNALVLKNIPVESFIDSISDFKQFDRIKRTLDKFGSVDIVTKTVDTEKTRKNHEIITLGEHTVAQFVERREDTVKTMDDGTYTIGISNDITGMEALDEEAYGKLLVDRMTNTVNKTIGQSTRYIDKPIGVFHNIEAVVNGKIEKLIILGFIFPNIKDNLILALNTENETIKNIHFRQTIEQEEKEGELYA